MQANLAMNGPYMEAHDIDSEINKQIENKELNKYKWNWIQMQMNTNEIVVCWLPGVGALVETEWFYEIITLMMVITGNVQLTSAENEDQSELVLFSKIPKSRCRNGCTSSSCGQLMMQR